MRLNATEEKRGESLSFEELEVYVRKKAKRKRRKDNQTGWRERNKIRDTEIEKQQYKTHNKKVNEWKEKQHQNELIKYKLIELPITVNNTTVYCVAFH